MRKMYLLRLLIFTITTMGPRLIAAANSTQIEVLCPQSFSKLSLAKLCPKKACRWKLVESSIRASSWIKRGQYKVIENPIVKGIKVEVLNGKTSGLALPWCFNQSTINLPAKNVLESLAKRKESLYLLEENDTHHLPRLKAIKHPCRLLTQLESNIKDYKFYYLKATKLKGCQSEK